ncbi:hypothetical protein FRC00_013479 [Tulasnella sp. 408]|nr:hypothetical protein FRC00_013479 [Tulasnella sp. 408]
MERSKDMSLDIDYVAEAHRDIHNPGEFLTTLFPHINRWRRASIVLRTCNPDLLHGLTIGAAPRLESFTLRVSHYHGRPLTLFAGLSPPCLGEFNVGGVFLLWDGEQFSNLQKLEIVAERWNALSLQRVLFILRTASMLEELSYRGDLRQVPPGENGVMSWSVIVLPVMKTLKLCTFGSSGALDILMCIRAPECRDVSVAGTLGDLGGPERLGQMYEAIVQFLPPIKAMANQGECVQIKVDDMDYLNHRVRTLPPTQVTQVAKWMVQNLADESMDIYLCIQDPEFGAEQLHFLIPPTIHRHVSKLRFWYQCGSITRYLSGGKLGSDGQLQWPLPHLREIAIICYGQSNLVDVLCMLQARADAANTLEAGGPSKIMELHLGYMTLDSEGLEIISKIEKFMQQNEGNLITVDVSRE